MVAESAGLFKPKNVSLIKRIDSDLFRSDYYRLHKYKRLR